MSPWWSWAAFAATVLNVFSIALNVSSRRRHGAMRWQPRTDDARRTKGDPPPTYAQLVAKVREQEEVNAYLARQRANLIAENARLRAAALPQLTPLAVDEDVTRAYVRDEAYEAYEPWEEVR